MKNEIKVGICVAYDWEFLHHSLPLIYNDASIICLSLDSSLISWSGKPFEFDDDSFNALIKTIDIHGKIKVIRENFHSHERTAMENEVHQRKRMAGFLGRGGWHVQLDCDEYFVNFTSFVAYLQSLQARKFRRTNICCPGITLYKRISEGFLYVYEPDPMKREYIPVATLEPDYSYGRRNGDFNHFTNFSILHQSWARQYTEVMQKLSNWGHNGDFDSEKYFRQWQNVNKDNFNEMKNFHPTNASTWHSLRLLSGSDIKECLAMLDRVDLSPATKSDLLIKNSRMVSKIRSILKKVI